MNIKNKTAFIIKQIMNDCRKCISLAIIFLLAMSASAQEYEPTLKKGAFWVVGIGQGMGSYTPYYTRLICDTVLINGRDYILLQVQDPDNQDCSSLLGYVREDIEEKQLFFYEENYNNGEELLIADYSLEVGDFLYSTWEVPIDSIFYQEFAGEQRKYFRFEGGYGGYYEGVGSAQYGVFPNCGGYKVLFNYETGNECNELVTTDNIENENVINIYPNPTEGNLNISYPDLKFTESITVEVVNTIGKIVTRKTISNKNTTIDLGHLPVGLYVISIKNENRIIVTKKIIRI